MESSFIFGPTDFGGWSYNPPPHLVALFIAAKESRMCLLTPCENRMSVKKLVVEIIRSEVTQHGPEWPFNMMQKLRVDPIIAA
jgi:hypothetical protein